MMSFFGELSNPISSAEDAHSQIVSATKGLWVLVAIQAVLLVILGVLSDATLALNSTLDLLALAACAWFLPRTHSRVLSVVLVLIAVGALVASLLAKLGVIDGGRNLILALVLFVASLQIARSAFAWHRFRPHIPVARNAFISCALATIYSMVALVVSAIAAGVLLTVSDEALGAIALIIATLTMVAAFGGLLPGTKNRPWAVES